MSVGDKEFWDIITRSDRGPLGSGQSCWGRGKLQSHAATAVINSDDL